MESSRADSQGEKPRQAPTHVQRVSRQSRVKHAGRRRGRPEDSSQGENENPKQPRKETKEHSSFFELRRTLADAPAVASYIDEHKGTRLRNPRHMNSFFQALSNCPDDLFACITQEHKSQVHLVLERMFELYSSGKVPMSLAAHEFIIRCEQHGVRKAEWYADMPHSSSDAPVPSDVAPLLSPRDLLRRLAALDARGRLERLIEMCTTPADLHTCARKLCSAAPAALDYATKCRLVSKLASKARRVCASADAEDSREALRGLFDALLDATRRALAARPAGAPRQQPIARLVRLAEWCGGRGLIAEEQREAVAALGAQAAEDISAQAAQLEAVARLKELTHGDDDAASAAFDDMWREVDGRFEPHSVDVLSSIAMACKGLSEKLREVTAKRLVRTQKWMAQNDSELPRRALRFVNEVQSRLKQEAVRRMLAEQDKTTEDV